jgi:SAM-dependent methyltransferase
MYEHFFGNPNFRLSTVLLFLHSLKKIEPESKILDFGCGSGTYYSNNKVIEIIKKSNLKIEGIDIDPVYIKKCRERVNNSLLENNVNILLKNIFDLTIENEVDKFDYIIFSESAPLLSSKLLESITEYINKNLIKKEGKIIFINNLVENENYMIKYKPLLKYILMIDFGRVLKFKEFDDLSKKINKNIEVNLIDEMSVSEILLFFNLYFLYPLLNLLGVKNYKVKQFEIIMK